MNKLARIAQRIAVLANENPCGWSDTVLDVLADGVEVMVSKKTDGGITMLNLAEYYKVSIRTIQRWRNDYADFPTPLDPYAKVLAFSVDDVVRWKQEHQDLF